jgi:acyl carrier protein
MEESVFKTDHMQNTPRFQNTFEFIKKTISTSSGIAEDKIMLSSTLFDELGIDSIDMVDILYMLENEYNISLKISDVERESRAEMGDEPFEIDGVITERGLSILKKRMPEIDPARLTSGINIYDIAKLISVHSLVNMVLHQLEKPQVQDK